MTQDNKAAYIQALIDSHEEESVEPFRRFMLREHIRNLQREISAYRKSMEDDGFLPHCLEVEERTPFMPPSLHTPCASTGA